MALRCALNGAQNSYKRGRGGGGLFGVREKSLSSGMRGQQAVRTSSPSSGRQSKKARQGGATRTRTGTARPTRAFQKRMRATAPATPEQGEGSCSPNKSHTVTLGGHPQESTYIPRDVRGGMGCTYRKLVQRRQQHCSHRAPRSLEGNTQRG